MRRRFGVSAFAWLAAFGAGCVAPRAPLPRPIEPASDGGRIPEQREESAPVDAESDGGDEREALVDERPTTVTLTRLVVGESHACALTDVGEVYCWGNDDQGQLGRENPDHRANFLARPVAMKERAVAVA